MLLQEVKKLIGGQTPPSLNSRKKKKIKLNYLNSFFFFVFTKKKLKMTNFCLKGSKTSLSFTPQKKNFSHSHSLSMKLNDMRVNLFLITYSRSFVPPLRVTHLNV